MSGPLRERDAELLAIAGSLADAADRGRGSVLFLRGEPGLGKTSLLRRAAAEAEAAFAVVLVGGHEMEQAYPFAVVHQAVETLVRAYGAQGKGLVDGLRPLRVLLRGTAGASTTAGAAEATPVRAEVVQCFYWLVASLAESRPLLLCLDDLHWSDPDSLEVMRYLAVRMEALPAVLLGGLRPWPAPAARVVERLCLDGGARIADLAPLGPQASADLLVAGLGAVPGTERAWQAYALTGGNPFLIEELVRIWRAEAAAEQQPPERQPRIERSLVLTRLADLPPASLRLLQAASVLGPELHLDVALGLVEVSGREADDSLAPLEGLGLLRRREGGEVAFLHPLLRQAVYDSLPPAARRALHQAAVRLLRARGAPAVELAPHIVRVARSGDAVAMRELRAAAAEAAAVGAWESAAVHLRAAAALSPLGPERPQILYELGRAYQRAGSQDQACAAFEEAVAAPQCGSRLAAQVRRSWGFSLTLAGETDAAREQLRQAVATAAESDPVLAAEVAVAQVVLEMTTSGMQRAAEAADEALRLAEASGDAAVGAKARAVWSNVAFQQGDPEALARARQARAVLSSSPPDENELLWGWSPRIALGMIAMRSEHYDEALAPLLQSWELAGTRRARFARLWASTFLTELCWRQGRLRDAFRYSGDVAVYPPGVPWGTALAYSIRGRVLMEMGDLEGAEASLVRAEAEAGRSGLRVAALTSAWSQAILAARRGLPSDAAARFETLAASLDSVGIGDLDSFRWCREAAEGFIRAGRLEEGRRLASSLLEGARRAGRAGAEAAAWRCLGLVAGIEGDDAGAERCFGTALYLHRQVDEAVERGRTLLAYGSWLRRRGEPKRARRVLDETCVILEACGAGYWLRQALAERRAAGGRRRARPQTGHLGWLTPQEYRIAELVHQGCSNRQIACLLLVSPKTLETHLHHIYTKLGVTTRAEIRDHFGRVAAAGEHPSGEAAAAARTPAKPG